MSDVPLGDDIDGATPARRSRRTAYSIVGAAERAAIARAVHARLTTKEYRALLAVLARTTTYSRLQDSCTHGVLAGLSGLDRRDLSRALKKLDHHGVISYVPGRGQRFSVVRIPEATPGESAQDDKAADARAEVGQSPGRAGAAAPALQGGRDRPPRTRRANEEDHRGGHNEVNDFVVASPSNNGSADLICYDEQDRLNQAADSLYAALIAELQEISDDAIRRYMATGDVDALLDSADLQRLGIQ